MCFYFCLYFLCFYEYIHWLCVYKWAYCWVKKKKKITDLPTLTCISLTEICYFYVLNVEINDLN